MITRQGTEETERGFEVDSETDQTHITSRLIQQPSGLSASVRPALLIAFKLSHNSVDPTEQKRNSNSSHP